MSAVSQGDVGGSGAVFGASGPSHATGVVPDPGAVADSTHFLREDATWVTIPGGGDALTSSPLSQFAATSSAQFAGIISDEVGTGKVILQTSPTLITPVLGVATATSVNKVAITAPAGSATLTIGDGLTLTVSGNTTVSGTHTGTSSGANTGDQTVSTIGASGAISDSTGTLAVARGGTGATDASGARTALGLVIGTDVQAQDAELAAIAGLTSAANKGITFTGAGTAATYDLTAFALTVLDDANASTARTTLGLAIGTDVQAYDADLAAIAGLTSAANKGITFTGAGTAATYDLTAAALTVLDDASVSAMRTTLGLAIGTDVQAYDAELAALAGLTSAADTLGYFTGIGTAATTPLTTAARAVLDDASVSAMRTTLGLAIGTDVQAQDAELAAIAGLTSAADQVPYFTGIGTAALATVTSAARSVLDDTSTANMLATLGALPTAGGTMAGAIEMGNNNITGAKQVCFNSVPTANKTGSAPNLADWTTGSIQEIVLTGNVTGTPTFTAPTGVSRLSLRVKQDGTGSRTMTWPTLVDWGSVGAPTLTTTHDKCDWITLIWDGATYQALAGIGAWG